MASRMIQIVPNEVRLPFQVGRELKASLNLTNISREIVLVTISASGRRRYSISHPRLSLSPSAFGTVEVTCEAQRSRPSIVLGRDSIVFECSMDTSNGKVREVIKVPVNFVDAGSPLSSPSSVPVISTPRPMFSPSSSTAPSPHNPRSPQPPLEQDSPGVSSDSTGGPPASSFRGSARAHSPLGRNNSSAAVEEKLMKLQNELDAVKEQSKEHTRALYRERERNTELKEKVQSLEDQLQGHETEQLELELEDSRFQIQKLDQMLEGAKKTCADYRKQYEALNDKMKKEREMHEQSTRSMLEEFQDQMRAQEKGASVTTADERDSEIAELSKELLEMTNACKSSITQNAQLQEDLEYVESERKEAIASREVFRKKAEEAQKEKDHLKQRMDELEAELESQRVSTGRVHSIENGSADEHRKVLSEEVMMLMRDKELLADSVAEAEVGSEEVAELREEIAEYREENKNMADEIQMLMKEKEHLQDSVSNLKRQSSLQNRSAHPKLEADRAAVRDLREKLAESMEENRKSEARVSALTMENSQLAAQIAELQSSAGTNDDSALEAEIEQYKAVNENLSEDILGLFREKRKQDQIILTMEASLARYRQIDPDSLTVENETLKFKGQNLKTEIRDLREKEEKLSRRVFELEELKVELQNQVDFLSVQNQQPNVQAEELQNTLETQRRVNESLNQQIKMMEEDAESLQEQLKGLQEALGRSEDSYAEAERFSESLRRQLESMQSQQGEIEREAHRKAQAEVVSLRSEVNGARQQTQEILQQMEDLQAQHGQKTAELRAEIQELNTELGRGSGGPARGPIEDLKREISQLQDEARRKDSEIAELAEEVKDYENNIVIETRKLELEILKEQKLNHELRMKLESKNDEVVSSLEDLGRVRTRLQSERAEKAKLEEEISAVNEKLKAATSEAKLVQKMKQQLAESAKQQQELAQDMLGSIEALQKEAQSALSAKGKMDEMVLRLETSDARRPGHVLKLRQRPNYNCQVCGSAGTGWGWKCGIQGCSDTLHPECLRRR